MDELLRRQSSLVSNHPSCIWGLLQFFNFYQNLSKEKMIGYRRHFNGRRARRTKIPKSKLNVSSSVEEQDFLNGEANFLMDDKVNATKKKSGKARMRTLISKLYKKQDQKKISPSGSRLLRTISIHHLECDDYVIPDESTSDSETSTVELSSQETDSSASSKHVPLPEGPDRPLFGQRSSVDYVGHNQLDDLGSHFLEKQAALMEKFNKTTESLLKQKGADAKEIGKDFVLESKDFLDMLELINGNRDLFLSIVKDSNSPLENYLRACADSSLEMALTKSCSFPGSGLSGRRNSKRSKSEWKGRDSFVNQESKSPAANQPSARNTIEDDSLAGALILGLGSAEDCSTSEFLVGSPCKLENQRDREAVLNRFKFLKQRIKDVIRENRKEQYRVSRDGFLHKIPYGHKVPEDVEKEKVRPWDGSASERYVKDRPRCEFRSDGSVSANDKHKDRNIQRSRSLTESLGSYSRLLESISLREPKRPLERLKSIQEHEHKFPKIFGRMFSNPEFGSYDLSKAVHSELSDAPVSLKIPASGLLVGDGAVGTYASNEPKSVSTPVHSEDNTESDTYGEHKVFINELDQNEACKVSDDLMAVKSSFVHQQEARIEVDSRDKATRPSPVSVIDSYFQEDPVSPVNYSVSEGSELIPRWVTFEELDSVADDVSNGEETIKPDFDHRWPIDLMDFNLRVNKKDEAEFNYVRSILNKSWFNEDFLEAWYYPYHPVDPLLFGEADGFDHGLDIARDEPDDRSIDHLLLFDLINEVLFDIYRSSFSQGPGLSSFGSCIKPKPVGNRVLQEVWTKINWHLSSQPDEDPPFDYVVAQDFARNDGWMNLQPEAECVGIELEGLILDDLLDEVLLSLGH